MKVKVHYIDEKNAVKVVGNRELLSGNHVVVGGERWRVRRDRDIGYVLDFRAPDQD